MPKPVKSHVFRGKRYRVLHLPPSKIKDALGKCSPPYKTGKTLKFDNTLKDLLQLEIYIHEALHAEYWDLDEEAIADAAYDLAKFLWKLGYRLNAEAK